MWQSHDRSSSPPPSIFGVGLFDQQVTSHYFPVHRKANYYFDGFDKGTESAFHTSSSLYCSTQLWEEALRALKVRIFKKLNRVNMTALQTTCTFPKPYTKVPTHKFTILPSYSLSSLFFSFALSLIQNTVNRTCTCTGKLVQCVRWFATGV